jgi:hypothetical protein
MPNNIKNRIEFKGDSEQIKQLIEKYSTFYPEAENFNFDKSLIMKHTDGSYGWYKKETNEFRKRNTNGNMIVSHGIPEGYSPDMIKAFTRFPDFQKVLPMPKAVLADLEAKPSGVSPLWYSWSVDNWGTKWNAYSCEKESEMIYLFETAWCSVPKIIEEISLSFPNVEIIYEWSDEDTGYNCGTAVYKNGLVSENIPTGGSKEAYELAFKLRPYHAEYYELIGDEYHYKED